MTPFFLHPSRGEKVYGPYLPPRFLEQLLFLSGGTCRILQDPPKLPGRPFLTPPPPGFPSDRTPPFLFRHQVENPSLLPEKEGGLFSPPLSTKRPSFLSQRASKTQVSFPLFEKAPPPWTRKRSSQSFETGAASPHPLTGVSVGRPLIQV